MPPTTRARTSPPVLSTQPDNVVEDHLVEDSDSNSSSPLSEDETDDENSPLVRSPSNLFYNLSSLSPRQQLLIKDTFNDPPQIALQQCRSMNGTYAFQMTELVTRSIRIHDNEDGPARLRCSCRDEDQDDDGQTCPHLIWLLDRLVQQTLYSHDHTKILNMTDRAYPEELGDPYAAISNHHLDILAAGLHCPVMDSSTNDIDPTRALEARELLSSIYDQSPEESRPDIFTNPTKPPSPIKRHDLDHTIFRMLVDNSHFFNYVHSHFKPTDAINDPFRKLRQRIDLVLASLDNTDHQTSTVAWAAAHILGCTSQIRSSVFSRDRPLRAREASSATSTLVHTLAATIDRHVNASSSGGGGGAGETRSLYHHLIGDKDRGFVISTLELLPEAASPFLYTLEELVERMSVLGVPASYVEKFRALFERLRRSRTGSGVKRCSQDEEGPRAKRVR